MQIAFFPWLYLKETITLDPLTFILLRDDNGTVPDPLKNLVDFLDVILKGYVDMHGKPVGNCVVVIHSDRNPAWDLQDEDHALIARCAQVLSLAAISENNYFTGFRCYANFTTFQFYRQRFTSAVDYIAFDVRRRDGVTSDMGYRHGEVKFPVPPQSKSPRYTCVDAEFARAIYGAIEANSAAGNRILAGLLFFNLANSDSDVMDLEAETLLMGSAFEQLFGTDGAYKLCRAFGSLFQPYGKVTVNEALSARPGIALDPNYDSAQRGWFLHRKWVEEIYDLRSHRIHGEPLESRKWGWAPLEHLVMGAFVFPIAVKLMLAAEGRYKFTDHDGGKAAAIDSLLAATVWRDRIPDSNETIWQRIVFDHQTHFILRRAIEGFFYEQRSKGPPSDASGE